MLTIILIEHQSTSGKYNKRLITMIYKYYLHTIPFPALGDPIPIPIPPAITVYK